MEVIILDLFLVDTDGGEDVGAVGSDEGIVLGAQGGTDGHPPEVVRVLIDVLNDAVYKDRLIDQAYCSGLHFAEGTSRGTRHYSTRLGQNPCSRRAGPLSCLYW